MARSSRWPCGIRLCCAALAATSAAGAGLELSRPGERSDRKIAATSLGVFQAVVWQTSGAGGGAEFYVDPDFAGHGQDGSPAKPWNSIRRAEVWPAINAALADAPVTVYFSACQADTDQPQTVREFVECRRSDAGSHRLTLDGMSKYNASDRNPVWRDYSGPHRCRIIGQQGQRALGWEVESVPAGKQNYVTVRGFECTGPGARVAFASDHVVLEHVAIHDVKGIGPGLAIHGPFAGDARRGKRVMNITNEPQ